MICERIELYKENEYDYPMAFGFRPFFMAYLHEDREIHPAILIIPGGGYEFVSSREGEIVSPKATIPLSWSTRSTFWISLRSKCRRLVMPAAP